MLEGKTYFIHFIYVRSFNGTAMVADLYIYFVSELFQYKDEHS